jgi:murein DD-endopeptidase MepM/ murein hydrolase activator NlpD
MKAPFKKHVLFALALAAATAILGAGAALAQTGGATTPTDPTAPPPAPTPAAGTYTFPVAGPHTYGDGFGAARAGHTHMGQDVMAACGTPLVAVSRSIVVYRKSQSLAGNYVVLKDKRSGQSYFYAHLAVPAMVLPRQKVNAGQQVGIVGDTGDATACHLHFELWTKGGWYRRGHAINPLATLQIWDSLS